MTAARPPEGAKAPSGGSERHAVRERGGNIPRQHLPSLRQSVLRRVLPPLAATWLAGTLVSAGVAQVFAQRAFDRSLLDDAYLLATHVQAEGNHPAFNLSRRELNSVLFDQIETVYFSIRDAQDRLVAGHALLRMMPSDPQEGWRFDDIVFEGQVLRAVTLHRDRPAVFEVTVAQTTTARRAMVRQLFLVSLLPQLALLLLLGWWLARTIRNATQPLAELEQAVENRGADDLAPVDVQARTHDVAALADAINSLLQRLARSAQAQREFAGNVAHELRTPLAGIRALAEYGLAQDDPARWREHLQAILASGTRTSTLVDKLLALAVAAEAEARPQLVALRLDEIIRQTVLRLLPRADSLGVDLGAEGIDSPLWIRGDANMVEGILNNLIDNALRYGTVPGHGGHITVAAQRNAQGVCLSVSDDGPGAPGQLQQELAARGRRGEAAQLLGQGAGIGLALVAQYAGLMGGEVRLSTGAGGRGWVCSVQFPPADAA